jgi:Icc-related predicted phosphoesterase
MKIVCISDTHTLHKNMKIPDGDLLIHAGDVSSRGKLEEIIQFNDWLGTLPHRHKVMIAGNHDFYFESNPPHTKSLITNAIYLNDSGIEIEGIKIWGSPVQPWFYDWAFNRQRGEDIRKHWELIPTDTDILITHGPPYGILDETARGELVGCADLLEVIQQRVKPRLHVFGHIHEGYGKTAIGETLFVNPSMVNLQYRPVNQAIVVELI